MTDGPTWAWGQLEIVLRKKEVIATKVGMRQEKSSPAAAFSSSYTKWRTKKNRTKQIIWQALSCEWMEPHTPNSVRDRLLFLGDPAVTSWVEKNKDDAGGFRITSGTSPPTWLSKMMSKLNQNDKKSFLCGVRTVFSKLNQRKVYLEYLTTRLFYSILAFRHWWRS